MPSVQASWDPLDKELSKLPWLNEYTKQELPDAEDADPEIGIVRDLGKAKWI